MTSRAFLVFVFCFSSNAGTQALRWEFDDFYRSNLLYLHPVVNYALHPLWNQEWEDNLFRANSVRFSFGSVTLSELFSDSRVVINERLIDGLWFRFDDTWYASHHVDREEKSRFVGLEQYILRGFSVFCYGDLAFNKEDADILLGISVSDSARGRYARVGFLDEDQFYDEKNDRGGVTAKRPLGVTWALNQRIGPLKIFSEGRFSTGFDRSFSDTTVSSDVSFHRLQDNRGHVKLYYHTHDGALGELAVSRVALEESKEYCDSAYDYDYVNRVTLFNVRCLFPIQRRNRLQVGSYYIRQAANSSGRYDYSFRRNEILPYLFFETERVFGIIELGYMGAFSKSVYDAAGATDDYERDSYIDKVEFGYTYVFSEKAKIHLSISHVLAIEEFGGGNAQFLLLF